MEENRSSFSGKIGYVLAVAGSAVGLGNIWRFPYLAAKYGGGIFLLVYILLAVTFGFALVMAETAIGRKTGKSGICAFRDLSEKHGWMGYLHAIIPIIIVPYYSVIGGWVMKYLAVFFGGGVTNAAQDGFFDGFIASTSEPLWWFLIFMILVFGIVMFGVEKGIEKVSKIMMPILALLSLFIAIYCITRPGAWEGVKYYILPDFSKLSMMTVVAAMSQMFYSLSIAMGILITFGSYMRKDINMEASVKQIEIFDIAIAFIAGLMIVPAVFTFSGGNEAALNAGPGLMFVTLPKVFESMGIGNIIGTVFFILVLFAALTSAISLMEAAVSAFTDKFAWGRKKACIVTFGIVILLGIPVSLGFGVWDFIQPLGMSILDFFDFISNSILMPIAALCTCYFVSKVIGTKAIADEVKISSKFKYQRLFEVVIKYIAPVCIIAILISSILNSFGIIKM